MSVGPVRSVLGVLLLLCAAPCSAHAFLVQASPGAGTVLDQAPEEIVLDFDRALEPAFSELHLTHADDGTPVDTGSTADPMQTTQLRLKLPELAPGRYRVSWSVVGRDGHRTHGAYVFTLK